MRDSFIFNLSDFNNREQQKTTVTKFKGVVSRLPCKFISLLTPIKRPFLLNENCEITCRLQNHCFVLKQTCLPSIISNVAETIKWTLKTFRLTSFCPSVPPFVLTVLFISSFQVVDGHFYVSLNLLAVSTVWILKKFETTRHSLPYCFLETELHFPSSFSVFCFF